MKILLLCWRDTTHPQGGGSERYLERVGSYLAQQGHEVIYRTSRATDAPRRSVHDGMVFHRAGGKYGVYPRAAVAMLAGRWGVGRYRDVDVVIDTQNGIPFFARVWSGRPTVLLTHHCHKEQWPVAGRVLARVGWWLESVASPRIYRGAPYVTVSTPSREELIALGVAPRDIRIIRNGCDVAPTVLPTLPKDDKQHVVTLSRLVPHKQIEHAIDAVAALDNVVLDVIGSGWWEENLKEYAQASGAGDRIIFHGQVAEDHKHALLASAQVHAMPSRKEGWGLAVIEAAQHGVPTVGYRSSGGLRDSVVDGETGILVNTQEQFLKALHSLLEDPDLREAMGEAASVQAETYSWEDAGKAVEELLLTLVPQSS